MKIDNVMNELKHELMIGNIITDSYGDERTVTALSEKSVHFRFDITDEYSICKPTPLTQQWFDKFNIKLHDDTLSEKLNREDKLFYIWNLEFTNSTNPIDVRGFYCWQINGGKTIIRYVHQLQNMWWNIMNQKLVEIIPSI